MAPGSDVGESWIDGFWVFRMWGIGIWSFALGGSMILSAPPRVSPVGCRSKYVLYATATSHLKSAATRKLLYNETAAVIDHRRRRTRPVELIPAVRFIVGVFIEIAQNFAPKSSRSTTDAMA
jgi:hypothetical protein